MKALTFLSVFFLLTFHNFCAQEIPNGNFESWGIYNGWSEEPTGWNTPNNQLIETTVKDLEAFEGDYAMRVNPYDMGVGEFGWANINVPIDFIPPSLDFFAKWEKTVTAAVGVDITFYNEDTPMYTAYWYADVDQSNWTAIHIPLDQIEPIMDHVIINVFVSIGDFVAGEGWISVDQMGFGLVDGLYEHRLLDELEFFPNPVSEMLFIKEASASATYVIVDVEGKQVSKGNYGSGIEVSELPLGTYTLSLIDSQGQKRINQFIVEH